MRAHIGVLKSERQSRGQHAGLLLHRFFHVEVDSERDERKAKDKRAKEKRALLEAARSAAQNDDVRSLYKLAFDRWSAALPQSPRPVDLGAPGIAGRLIVGLGSENVLETGIRLHHNYGMPIIPGSALKGLAAHYCHEVCCNVDNKFLREKEYHRMLFGTNEESGYIVFHDAWYVPDSSRQPLVLDVMTPHHPNWNNPQDPLPPTDFDGPTPVPFLSATGKFRVAVGWYGPPSDQAEKWSVFALQLVQKALSEWGVGGKTTSGYGRLFDAATTATEQPTKASHADGATPASSLKSGVILEVVLHTERSKSGGWKARVPGTDIIGAITNSGAVPQDATAGKTRIQVKVRSANPMNISFDFLPPDVSREKASPKKTPPKK